MNIVDSSGWLEYLADAPGADFFAPAIEALDELLVPTICMLEVARIVHRQRGEDAALQALALMQQGQVVNLDSVIILRAARLGKAHQLPLADSVVLATARVHDSVVWTQDSDFEGLDGVKYIPKKS
ncbi:MAG TPA: type II toxin-antitoxin system VapC family toxin [Thermoanaerobaculia bacterium]|nr:type II toxin-antitoxin system VapC family toxin [Thermoanaerobaculia bacterium]